MPFCSRRTWKTPSGFTTWPTPGCYDDGVVLPRFRSHTHTGKTTGVYHDNHPDTAPDAGLRVPLLTRHHPGCCPTFIPAFTVAPWIALLAASIAVACIMNSALVGSSATAPAPQTVIVTPAATPDPGPSCTWIGAYCAFPDR